MTIRTKANSRNIGLVVFSGLGSFTYGYVSVLAGSIIGLPSFFPYFGIDTTTDHGNSLLGAMNGLFYGGAAIGCWLIALMADGLGRKRCLQIVAALCVLAGAIQAGSVHIAMFLIGRFLAGASVGMACCIVPTYTSEISPPGQRGRLVGTHGIALTAGYSTASWVCFGCYYAKIPALQWRLPLALQCFAPLLLFIGAVAWLPESPRWLIAHGHDQQARKVLKYLHSAGDTAPIDEVNSEFESMAHQIHQEKAEYPTIWSMFKKPSIRGRLLRGFLLQFLVQSTGVLVIANYQIILFNNLGVKGSIPIMLIALKTAMASFLNWVNSMLLDRIGRIKILLIGLIGCLISVSCYVALVAEFLGTTNKAGQGAAVAFLFIFVVMFAGFIDASVFVYVAEIFPNATRAHGVGFSTSALFVANLIYNMSAPLAMARIGWRFFLIFIIVPACGIYPFLKFCPETKGRTLEEIGALFGDDVVCDAGGFTSPNGSKNLDDVRLKATTVDGISVDHLERT